MDTYLMCTLRAAQSAAGFSTTYTATIVLARVDLLDPMPCGRRWKLVTMSSARLLTIYYDATADACFLLASLFLVFDSYATSILLPRWTSS